MNPNDVLGAVNIAISAAFCCFGVLFLYSLVQGQPQGRLRQVFTAVMCIGYFLMTLDYGTTGVLRVIDLWAFPDVPHSLLPDFRLFPLGITLLLIWRILLAVVLWSLLFYVVVIKRGVDEE